MRYIYAYSYLVPQIINTVHLSSWRPFFVTFWDILRGYCDKTRCWIWSETFSIHRNMSLIIWFFLSGIAPCASLMENLVFEWVRWSDWCFVFFFCPILEVKRALWKIQLTVWSLDARGSSNITGWPTGKRRCDLVFQLDDDSADPDVDGSLGVRLNRWTIL